MPSHAPCARSPSFYGRGALLHNRALVEKCERYRCPHQGQRDVSVIADAANRVIPPRDFAHVRALLLQHRNPQAGPHRHDLRFV